ncbi:MAG TPA: D-aminoacyl-tRNA deacylase [Bacteroidota bacterium]
MKALIQRVSKSAVRVDGRVVGETGKGMLVLLSVKHGDTEEDARFLSERCLSVRIFEDENEKMNRSVVDVGGEVLIVSQFTLHADTRKGNRPSFDRAAPPDVAERLYGLFVEGLKQRLGEGRVATGVFRARMDVELVNDGPVTIILESKSEFPTE